MTPGRCCRALRAATFAAACVLLAAVGHALMSGKSVPWWAMSAAFATTCATAWALAARERGVLVVTSVTVAAQAVLHTAFSLAQATVNPALPESASFTRQWVAYLLCGSKNFTTLPTAEPLSVAGSAGGHVHASLPTTAHMVLPDGGGHIHHAMGAMADSTLPSAGDGMAAHMSPTGMLAAHLLAALLCGFWLAYGERGAFRVLRSLAGWLVAPLRLIFRLTAPPHRPRIHVRRVRRAVVLRKLLLITAFTTRGPPPGIAVV
ncbi:MULTISPECIES: hypothetical protein [unclassified Streptomyces]|uniref:hypothetical protein n=1 Tax=unclassified Streptomyces TaxID=2593676 RepID=UPI002DDBBED8|nr:hypothetical protein [Streptomyces sp. NBC_01750]WSA98622.1 hypothetical protein OIE54_04750 [Streptomyces sp. NBC_01794]WSD36817.1 hypothetical protein OG966_35870 [Streptomyces sp. NBC_01750]